MQIAANPHLSSVLLGKETQYVSMLQSQQRLRVLPTVQASFKPAAVWRQSYPADSQADELLLSSLLPRLPQIAWIKPAQVHRKHNSNCQVETLECVTSLMVKITNVLSWRHSCDFPARDEIFGISLEIPVLLNHTIMSAFSASGLWKGKQKVNL